MYLAASADAGDVNGLTNAGYARLYAKSGTDWNVFQSINGTQSFGYFGYSLDLSHDGSMLAISAEYGRVYMYELSSSSFLYELLHTTDDISAYEVSVSGDGMVVDVTSESSSIGAKIFERIGDVFQQRGTDISGYGQYSGIALNFDGSIVIVGDAYWDSDTATNIGRAAVVQWRDGNEDGSIVWVQMGSDITGDAAFDYLGDYGCVSITNDGLTVALGAWGYDRDGLSQRGLVRVYNHDSISDTWKQNGIDLVGDNASDEFSKTALSPMELILLSEQAAEITVIIIMSRFLQRKEITIKQWETRLSVKQKETGLDFLMEKVKYICTIPYCRHPQLQFRHHRH